MLTYSLAIHLHQNINLTLVYKLLILYSMTIQVSSKLNQLERLLPQGLLTDAAWMERNGYSRALRHQYVSSGWLVQPARSVYRRPWGEMTWEQVLISLQTLMAYPVTVGGRTALELQGYAHYLPQSQNDIHLYSDKPLPGWLHKLDLPQTFIVHNRSRFLPLLEENGAGLSLTSNDKTQSIDNSLKITQWGQWNWPLIVSAPERAILEVMDELPKNETFHMADMLMEGLVNLRPRCLQTLLEQASSVKVKRLFLFFAERHGHAWFSQLDLNKIDLGSGKRVLVQDGKLNKKYQITLPLFLFKEEGSGI
jgi:hypothetical protein